MIRPSLASRVEQNSMKCSPRMPTDRVTYSAARGTRHKPATIHLQQCGGHTSQEWGSDMKSTCFESPRRVTTQPSIMEQLVVVSLALILGACQHCAKCTTLIVALPYVEARRTDPPVRIEVEPTSGAAPTITCSWASSASAGGDWTCTKDRNGTSTNKSGPQFYYDLPSADTNWTITMTGPAGTRTFAQASAPGNVGDGVLPGDCQCDSYEIDFHVDDLKSVGIVSGTDLGPYVGADAGPSS